MGVFKLFILSALVIAVSCKPGKFGKYAEKAKDGHFETGGEGQAEFDKEVLWQGDEQDPDGDILDLPVDEQKRRLKLLVEKKMDKNQDGVLSYDEIYEWTLRSFDAFETEESELEFDDIDTNADELIQWKEIEIDRYGEEFSENPEKFKEEGTEWADFAETYDKDKRQFAAADVDESGALTLQEYLYFKHPRLHDRTKVIVIEETLKKSDLDGDNAINMEEYLGDFKKTDKGNEPDWVAMDKEKFTNELDKDGDSYLRGDEILEWTAPSNKDTAKEETEHLIEECDNDKDGVLTSEEIVNNHDIWIDSDATDYGNQLLKSHDEL